MATQNEKRSSLSSSTLSDQRAKRVVLRSRKGTDVGLNEIPDTIRPVPLSTSTPIRHGGLANGIAHFNGNRPPRRHEDSSTSNSSADDEVFFRPPTIFKQLQLLPNLHKSTSANLSLDPPRAKPPLSPRTQFHLNPIKLPSQTPSDSFAPPLSSPLAPLLTASLRKNSLNVGTGTTSTNDCSTVLDATLPNRTLKVFVGTWNMHEEKDVSSNLEDFLLPLSQKKVADLYAIGSQESTPNRLEWEVLLQETLGPTHVLVQSEDSVKSDGEISDGDNVMSDYEVQSSSFATRPITAIKTKGSVGIRLMLFGSRLLFITSHFSAGVYNTIERNSNMHKILNNLVFPNAKSKLLQSNDFIFWCGDFNYRIELERDEVDKAVQERNYMSILLHDQLTCEILAGNVFEGFSEQPINFPPTYKYDINTDSYDTSELRRVPSWTDRVMFRALSKDTIIGCGYDVCQTVRSSDHRPVYATFKVFVKPCCENEIYGVPMTPARYNRDLYIKALKKRKESISVAMSTSKHIGEEEVDSNNPKVVVNRSQRQSTTTSALCFIL